VPTPIREGYHFEGWRQSNGVSFGSSTVVTNNMTVAAEWRDITYLVQYKANGGSGAPPSQKKHPLSDLILQTDAPTPPTYTITYNADGGYDAPARTQLQELEHRFGGERDRLISA